MREAFIDKTFQPKSRALVLEANAILEEYRRQGYRLTIRQIYYQMVSRDLIPNNMKSYKRIVNLLGDARMIGMMDWASIEDRNRNMMKVRTYESPAETLQNARDTYYLYKWDTQPCHIEIMIEKQALESVLWRTASQWEIGLTSNKGYTSLSELYECSKRMIKAADAGKHLVILHLADHDPSGIDMTRDLVDRLDVFTRGLPVIVERLALNMAQVEQYNPPPNPAKQTDSRYESYLRKHGNESWELDALEPSTLNALTNTAVLRYVDMKAWAAKEDDEEEHREWLDKVIDDAHSNF